MIFQIFSFSSEVDIIVINEKMKIFVGLIFIIKYVNYNGSNIYLYIVPIIQLMRKNKLKIKK